MVWQGLFESTEIVTGFILLVGALIGGLTIIVKAAAKAAVEATELRLKNQRIDLEAKITENEVKQAEAFTDQAVMRTMTESAFNMSTIMQQLVEMQKTTQNQIGEIQRAYINESAAWREVVIENRDKLGELEDTTKQSHARHDRVIHSLIQRIERLLEKIQKIVDMRSENEHQTPEHNDSADNTADAGANTSHSAGRDFDEHATTDEPTSTDVF